MLMGQHIVHLSLVHAAGQIDAGPQDTQQEGRCDRVAQPDILPQTHALPHTVPQPQGADKAVQQQRTAHRQPDHHIGRHIPCDGMGRIRRRVLLHRRDPRRADGLHIQLDRGLIAAGVNILEICHAAGILHGGRSGHLIGRHRRLQADGTDQPHRHQCPQQTGDPPGRLFQQQPQHQHRQDQPSGSHAHVGQLHKDLVHTQPSPASSIIRRSSSRSSSVSFRPCVKAAINAGSDPSKLSATYCWL